jgi:hypothetical protein
MNSFRKLTMLFFLGISGALLHAGCAADMADETGSAPGSASVDETGGEDAVSADQEEIGTPEKETLQQRPYDDDGDDDGFDGDDHGGQGCYQYCSGRYHHCLDRCGYDDRYGYGGYDRHDGYDGYGGGKCRRRCDRRFYRCLERCGRPY